MAKIRYLINNNPYDSMVHAIKTENIVYARFYNQFKESWGRLSIGFFGEDWNDEMAKRSVDGVDVFGLERAVLFSDGVVDYKYTKMLVKLIGADYDKLFSQRGDVDYFYIDLKGVKSNLDFSNELVVKNAMNNLRNKLGGVDSIKLHVAIEKEVKYARSNLASYTLDQLRAHELNIDFDTAEYLSADLTPSFTFLGMPSSEIRVEEEYETQIIEGEEGEEDEEVEVFVSSSEYIDRVDGVAISVDESIYGALSTFLFHTNYIDSMFNSISFTATPLPDRVVYNEDDSSETTYERCSFEISFDFGSDVNSGYVKTTYADGTIDYASAPIPDGSVIDRTNYSYLDSDEFVTFFTQKFNDAKQAYQTDFCDNYENVTFDVFLEKELSVVGMIVSVLNEFSDVDNIFYSKSQTLWTTTFTQTYLRFDRVNGIRNKEFGDIIFSAIHLGYKSKKKHGWFGGSFFGKLLEIIFVMVVVVVGIVSGQWWAIPLAMGILFISVKYGGMSQTGIGFAGFGMKVLGVVAIAYGVYDIYEQSFNIAKNESVLKSIAESQATLTTAEVTAAIATVSASDVVLAMGFSGVASMASSLYSAFNLLSPTDKITPSEDIDFMEDEVTTIYSINSAYDLYDEIYNVYS